MKGAVVGWLLDIEIRRTTSGARSLDDVLHAALLQYSGTDGFTPEQFQRIAEEVAETSLEPFWDAYVRGTDELSYDTALQWLGLTMAAPGDALPWLGISLDSTRGKTVIRNIHRDSPAFNSPLIVGDEIIALDEFRIQGNSLDSRLEQLNDRTEFTVLASRRGMIFETVIRPDQRSAPKWVLQPAPRPTKLQQNNHTTG